MDLKKGELRVHYQCGYEVNIDLDKALEKVLREQGYERWASGCDLTNGVRDLAFCSELPSLGEKECSADYRQDATVTGE